MRAILFITCFFGWQLVFSQRLPSFKPLRYEEDYAFLAGDTIQDWYHSLKYYPLSGDKRWYLSTGGDFRVQHLFYRNENWGDEPADRDGYMLTRWLLHTDLHAGARFRTFVQLQSSLANGRPSPSLVEDNPLDLHQAFFDVNVKPKANATLTFRMGRQELLYGSQRLISVREGPNNRQAFDAARAILSVTNHRVDILYGHYVRLTKGLFDDGFNRNVKLWGAYTVHNSVPVIKNVDFYYLGLYRANAFFDDARGRETRHSVGSRIWKSKGSWEYDIEGAYQFGKADYKKISAWTASVNTSYKFERVRFTPEIGMKTELISGDKRKGDDLLQTFNPLFPRGAYFGLAALIGPANLVDAHPALSLFFTPKVNFDIDYDVFWRYSRQDGIYEPNVALIYPAQDIFDKHIGRQLTGSVHFRPNPFLYFMAVLTWFDAGSYLAQAGAGKDILFTAISAQVRF